MGYVYECLSPPAEYLDVSPPDVFCKKKGAVRNFAKFKGNSCDSGAGVFL